MDMNGYMMAKTGEENEMGVTILEIAMAYDLAITNTFFEKKKEHIITFRSGGNESQIDYFMIRRKDLVICKNCKVIPGESLVTA